MSTYELGRQPVHVSSPASAIRGEGHEVEVVDLAVDDFEVNAVDRIDAVAISVPMHTATRLALMAATEIKARRPDLPVALYGLYAGVPESSAARSIDAAFAGEYEPDLLSWISELSAGGSASAGSSRTGRSDFHVPDREGLPPLESYARLEFAGATRLAAAVEASHGCRHRCRHCPIPAVYDGRMRVVPKDVVLADIDQLVASGAQHITFGDADFLNAPRHSLDLLAAAHSAHPDLTFDATIKVSHIIEQEELWPELADLNMLFVISAFESVDNKTLEILDKGHTVSDMSRASEIVRSAGVYIRPTWLPFLPWTTPADIASIFDFIGQQGLADATDPVQMSIRLLIPRGSLLEAHPAVSQHLTGYDDSALTWRWDFADPDTAVLHKELEAIAANASDCGQEVGVTLEEMRQAVSRRSGRELDTVAPGEPVPRLTESWFCCSEPTEAQSVSIRLG